MLTIKIQQEETQNHTLPYPFFISPDDGAVGRQDFWKGSPLTLLGFNDTRETGSIELPFLDFVENPEAAVGMYPVFEDDKGGISTYQLKVTSAYTLNV